MPSTLALGLPGFSYADLYEPARLRDLHEAFLAEVAARDPELGRQWDAHRQDPDAGRPGPERSLLYTRMAPHLSRFVARLFGVEAEAAALAAGTRAFDEVFRFKADFVRRRVVPLLKGGAPVTASAEDDAVVARLMDGQFPSRGETALVGGLTFTMCAPS